MFRNLITKNRSYRRFDNSVTVNQKILKELVGLARMSPSAGNLQPLKYILSSGPRTNSLIFPCLKWAGYLKQWKGPSEKERPSAYIIILGDTGITRTFGCDHGIAAQSILLGAVEKGFGGCMLGAIERSKLKNALKIPTRYEILLVIAIGKPLEKVVLETKKRNRDIKYWRDKRTAHHVPKRRLNDIILKR